MIYPVIHRLTAPPDCQLTDRVSEVATDKKRHRYYITECRGQRRKENKVVDYYPTSLLVREEREEGGIAETVGGAHAIRWTYYQACHARYVDLKDSPPYALVCAVDVRCTGGAYIQNGLTVTGMTTVDDLTTTYSALIGTTLTVDGATQLNNTLNVSEATSVRTSFVVVSRSWRFSISRPKRTNKTKTPAYSRP